MATEEKGDRAGSDYWCSLHPDAPKPIYEYITYSYAEVGPGWEHVCLVNADELSHQSTHLWRRIVGYTKAGE